MNDMPMVNDEDRSQIETDVPLEEVKDPKLRIRCRKPCLELIVVEKTRNESRNANLSNAGLYAIYQTEVCRLSVVA